MLELLHIIRNLIPLRLTPDTKVSPYRDTRFIVQQAHRNPVFVLFLIELRHR